MRKELCSEKKKKRWNLILSSSAYAFSFSIFIFNDLLKLKYINGIIFQKFAFLIFHSIYRISIIETFKKFSKKIYFIGKFSFDLKFFSQCFFFGLWMHLNLHILPLRSLFRTFSFECEWFECTLNECKCNILQESTICSGSASMFFFLIRRFVHYSLTHSTSIEKYSDRIRFDFSNLMRCSYLKLSIILQLFFVE